MAGLVAQRYAQQVGEPVYRWVMPLCHSDGPSAQKSEQWVELGAKSLVMYFVRGAPAALTMSGALGHPSWGACNRARGVLHSFSGPVPAESLCPAAAGKVFTIPQPEFVNVALRHNGGGAGLNIVPLQAAADKQPFAEYAKGLGKAHCKSLFQGRTPSVMSHDVELGFTSTYHSVQGATIGPG